MTGNAKPQHETSDGAWIPTDLLERLRAPGSGARRCFERASLAALLDLGLTRATIARYHRIPEPEVHLLCRAYRL